MGGGPFLGTKKYGFCPNLHNIRLPLHLVLSLIQLAAGQDNRAVIVHLQSVYNIVSNFSALTGTCSALGVVTNRFVQPAVST